MRMLRAIYRIPIGTYSPEGSFAAVTERLSEVITGGFDAVLLSSFDGRAGSMTELVTLCSRLHERGLAVLLDIACLYGGVASPAPVIDAAIRRGLADGFLLTGAEWKYADVRDTVKRLHKERGDLWFALSDCYATEGERPDGAGRRGFSPARLVGAAAADIEWSAQLAAVGRGRGITVTELLAPASSDSRRVDLCLALAWLLPGIPIVTPDALHTVQSIHWPTDAECYEKRRREELLLRLYALCHRYPALAESQGALHAACCDGTLTFTRRVSDGTLTVCVRLVDSEGEVRDRTVLSQAPMLTSGLYRRDGHIHLSPYGFAVCFVPKAERASRPTSRTQESITDENANKSVQIDEETPNTAENNGAEENG